MYLFIESGFYNTTKRSILKRLKGFAADLPIASSLAFAAVRAKRSRQFTEGGRTRTLCESRAAHM